MVLLKNSLITNIRLFSVLFLIISFIFLSGVKFENFQLRFLILLLIFPCVLRLYNDIKLKNYNFIIFFTLVFLSLSIQIIFNLQNEDAQLTNYSLLGIIFFLSIFTISYYYFNFINKNIHSIVNFFLIIFFISCLYSVYDYQADAAYFCGGIPYFFESSEILSKFSSGTDLGDGQILIEGRVKDVRFSFREFIFPENSHLGMIAPSILIYSIYKSSTQKNSFIFKISIFIFFIICFIKSSTTFFVGFILSSIFITSLNYKILNKKSLVFFSFLTIIFSTILLTNKECKSRFVPIYSGIDVLKNYVVEDASDKSTNENSHKEIDKRENLNFTNNISKIMNSTGNLSSGIYFHALTIAKRSLIEKPFGWGLNRYDKAFAYFNNLKPSKINRLNFYNNKDGTNNLVKITVEFGVFSFLLYLFFLFFTISKNIPIELKLFYIPFIITQSLRGAGYFNGGFALIVFLMLFTYLNKNKKTL